MTGVSFKLPSPNILLLSSLPFNFPNDQLKRYFQNLFGVPSESIKVKDAPFSTLRVSFPDDFRIPSHMIDQEQVINIDGHFAHIFRGDVATSLAINIELADTLHVSSAIATILQRNPDLQDNYRIVRNPFNYDSTEFLEEDHLFVLFSSRHSAKVGRNALKNHSTFTTKGCVMYAKRYFVDTTRLVVSLTSFDWLNELEPTAFLTCANHLVRAFKTYFVPILSEYGTKLDHVELPLNHNKLTGNVIICVDESPTGERVARRLLSKLQRLGSRELDITFPIVGGKVISFQILEYKPPLLETHPSPPSNHHTLVPTQIHPTTGISPTSEIGRPLTLPQPSHAQKAVLPTPTRIPISITNLNNPYQFNLSEPLLPSNGHLPNSPNASADVSLLTPNTSGLTLVSNGHSHFSGSEPLFEAPNSVSSHSPDFQNSPMALYPASSPSLFSEPPQNANQPQFQSAFAPTQPHQYQTQQTAATPSLAITTKRFVPSAKPFVPKGIDAVSNAAKATMQDVPIVEVARSTPTSSNVVPGPQTTAPLLETPPVIPIIKTPPTIITSKQAKSKQTHTPARNPFVYIPPLEQIQDRPPSNLPSSSDSSPRVVPAGPTPTFEFTDDFPTIDDFLTGAASPRYVNIGPGFHDTTSDMSFFTIPLVTSATL
ncbi:hypothetical protein BLNAU_10456 [Blattamonas nauphoetae]|uniref:Uncharacterized protein n=1 Tax=Blattamonas nauphoetae TaxID=2049346 RepID=A0ABQ9XS19_9EUKA|nr:hypothetical protein BLNAU_10456 [Blattamonas nauphoetae]